MGSIAANDERGRKNAAKGAFALLDGEARDTQQLLGQSFRW